MTKDNQPSKGAVRANLEPGTDPKGPAETPAASIATEGVNRAEPGAPLTVTPPEGAAPVSPEAPREEPARSEPKPRYTVAEGRSITSLKGILDAGGEVRAEYFAAAGGEGMKARQEESLQALVAAGAVVDNYPASQ